MPPVVTSAAVFKDTEPDDPEPGATDEPIDTLPELSIPAPDIILNSLLALITRDDPCCWLFPTWKAIPAGETPVPICRFIIPVEADTESPLVKEIRPVPPVEPVLSVCSCTAPLPITPAPDTI